jgi:hypothetical protein
MDDRDARYMRRTLTPKGQALVEQIALALAPKVKVAMKQINQDRRPILDS